MSPTPSPTEARVFVHVSGGVADYEADGPVQVALVDLDFNEACDPGDVQKMPLEFIDLLKNWKDIPYESRPNEGLTGVVGLHVPHEERQARVAIVVVGGVANLEHDGRVKVELIDEDNYKADPDSTPKVSREFADLAALYSAPVEGDEQRQSSRMRP